MANLRFKKYRCSYHWNLYSPKSNCKVRKTYAYSFHDDIYWVSIKFVKKNNLEILITNTWKLTYNKCTGYDYPDIPGLGNEVPEYNSGSGTYFTEKNRVIVILFVRITWSYYYPEKLYVNKILNLIYCCWFIFIGTNFIINFHSEFNLSIFVCVKI